MSDYSVPKNHLYIAVNDSNERTRSALHRAGPYPYEVNGRYVHYALVRFDGSHRRYTYWVPPQVYHRKFRWLDVCVNGAHHIVQVTSFARVSMRVVAGAEYKGIAGYYDPVGGQNAAGFEEDLCECCEGKGTYDERIGGIHTSNPEAKCPDCDGRGWIKPTIKKETPAMGLKIEDKKFVNGHDIKDYTEAGLYELLAQSQAEIDQLAALPGNSKKIARKIEQLKAAQAELVELIDKDEPADEADARDAQP